MSWRSRFLMAFVLLLGAAQPSLATQSVVRQWNESLLRAIRRDLARPTVTARNLFHFSIAAYDAWAVFDSVATPYLLGQAVGGHEYPFDGFPPPADIQAAREEAISYAEHRLLHNRFLTSPGAVQSLADFDSLLTVLGYDPSFTSTDYSTGSPAALGNYIGQTVIDMGLQDGSNEQNAYAYQYYAPLNPPLVVALPGDPTLIDPNRWQPLKLAVFIDQNGNVIGGTTPKFLTPEWGNVTPFALGPAELSLHFRGGFQYKVYDDPGAPATLDTLGGLDSTSALYKWGFELVSVWSSHLKATDTVMWDISPASLGNNAVLPHTAAELPSFYNLLEGGDHGTGRPLNPRTGLPYTPQFVPRGDYTRVLAEFWADGPNSETPPGHWFTILNYVNDNPALVKRLEGQGPVLDDLQWDVKAYFALGGAVHDAAIAAWSIKGWYDYVRPISAIRWMAGKGQCTDPGLPHYSPLGLPLIPGFTELVHVGDPLAGPTNQNVNKIKIYAWRGPSYIFDPVTDEAGVDWILAENWWPYQRPTFVTPPFAGYISGHSTYSRASAEVLTRLTGDEYFPGGMGEFHAPMNSYLVFEDGPSVDVTLQWATYRDASDQCSLSRIWGGIHPPQDDMPGRLIGRTIGQNAVNFAEEYFSGANPTPALVERFEAHPVAEGIEVSWQWGGESMIRDSWIERATSPSGPWERHDLARTAEGSSGVGIDRDVVPGVTYYYCLGVVTRDGVTRNVGLVSTTMSAAVTRLELATPAPNPTYGAIDVQFALPTGAEVDLSMFDVAGKEVARLARGHYPAGRFHKLWNARRGQSSLAPGVYFLRLSSAAQILEKKVILLR